MRAKIDTLRASKHRVYINRADTFESGLVKGMGSVSHGFGLRCVHARNVVVKAWGDFYERHKRYIMISQGRL